MTTTSNSKRQRGENPARLARFAVTRTVTNNTSRKQYGRSAEIELPADDVADAKQRVAALFSHETDAIATYDVKMVRKPTDKSG